jgi:hypothetical protein
MHIPSPSTVDSVHCGLRRLLSPSRCNPETEKVNTPREYPQRVGTRVLFIGWNNLRGSLYWLPDVPGGIEPQLPTVITIKTPSFGFSPSCLSPLPSSTSGIHLPNKPPYFRFCLGEPTLRQIPLSEVQHEL